MEDESISKRMSQRQIVKPKRFFDDEEVAEVKRLQGDLPKTDKSTDKTTNKSTGSSNNSSDFKFPIAGSSIKRKFDAEVPPKSKRKRLQRDETDKSTGSSNNSSDFKSPIAGSLMKRKFVAEVPPKSKRKRLQRDETDKSTGSSNNSSDFKSPIAGSLIKRKFDAEVPPKSKRKRLQRDELEIDNSGNSSIDFTSPIGHSSFMQGNLDAELPAAKRFEAIVASSDLDFSSTLNSSVGVDIPEYESETEYHLEAEKEKRRKKVQRTWTLEKTFRNADEAIKFVKSEKIWSTSTTNYILQGRKVIYRCTKAKERGIPCEAGVSLLFCIDTDDVLFHRADNQHTCHLNPTTHVVMTDELKDKITAIFLGGLRKRKEIETELAKAKLTVPHKSKMNNFLSKLRKTHYGSPKITLSELEANILGNLLIPDDEDEAFIVDYLCDYENLDFQIFISSKRLLRNAINSYVVSADSTYKMTWQGYPLSPVGTTDMDRHFHLFGVVLSQTENSNDYKFMFRTLKNGVQKLFQYEMKPRILIADASGAIHNGFKVVFGDDILILMCWFHAKKAVKKNLPKLIPDKKIQASILNDMDKLQICQTPDHFKTAADLFLKKYEKHVEFCKYFQQVWLVENPNWFEGATTEIAPSTNNAMESWNRLCKDEKTKRVRLPLDTFYPKMLEWVKEWSEQYPSKAKVFVEKPTVDTKLWTEAYKWTRLNKHLKANTDETNGLCYYEFTAGLDKSKPMSKLPTDWKNFDDFTKVQFGQWRTYISTDWQNATCNCPVFKKEYICKHCVGLAIRLKYVEPPLAAKALPLEKKRKPGRPANTKKALDRQ